MAKKKGKKKEQKKKDLKKKNKGLKDKARKKKERKKKAIKKKDSKKKEKKSAKKKTDQKKTQLVKPPDPKEGKTSITTGEVTDQSLNYNVRDAVKILRGLKNPEDVRVFTRGENRMTITRAIPAVLMRFQKSSS